MTKSTPTSFEGIAQYCRQHIKGLGLRTIKKNYAQILGLPSTPIQKSSHFEILGDDENKILSVEFHIEKDEGTKILQTFIKYWEGIYVLDKKIQYDLWRYKKGRLGIKCNYSDGEEKICAYIYEFIYQVKSRIENIITLGGSK